MQWNGGKHVAAFWLRWQTKRTQRTVKRRADMNDKPASTHDVTDLLVWFNLVWREADLTTARDTFTLGNVSRHSRTFTRQQSLPETDTADTLRNYSGNIATMRTATTGNIFIHFNEIIYATFWIYCTALMFLMSDVDVSSPL